MNTNLWEKAVYIGSVVYVTHFIRYLILAGLAFLIFYKWKRSYWQHKKIQNELPKPIILKKEFLYSLSTFFIFSCTGILIYWLKDHGYTKIYDKTETYGTGYLILSVFISLVIHDTYFYWTHRLMHWRLVFPWFHKVHHLSFNPSPWASFSFHPLEAVVEAGILPVLIFILPLHVVAIGLFLLIMTIMNVIGHLGYELYPAGFLKTRLGKINNTSTHHNMHHQYGRSNYGLYFNWWDRIMGTNHEKYSVQFEKIAGRTKEESMSALKEKKDL